MAQVRDILPRQAASLTEFAVFVSGVGYDFDPNSDVYPKRKSPINLPIL